MPDPVPPIDPSPTPATRSATWLEVIPAVLASFFGVRKGRSMQRDGVTIRPVQVVVVGIALAACLVGAIVTLVRFIIRSAGA